jgi:hypothetical protein
MSIWTDIRDTIVGIVTAPVRIPVQLISDIVSGRNVFDSAGKALVGSFAAFNPVVAPLSVVKAAAPGAVSSLGFIPGLDQFATAGQQINAQGVTKDRALALGEGFAKFGVTAAGAIAFGAPGAIAGKSIASGDVKGLLASGVGGEFLGDAIPSELVDSAREAAELARSVASRPQVAPIVNVAPNSKTTTALAPVVSGGPSPVQIAVLGGALVLGLMMVKRRG